MQARLLLIQRIKEEMEGVGGEEQAVSKEPSSTAEQEETWPQAAKRRKLERQKQVILDKSTS